MADQEQKLLFGDFPPVSTSSWEDKIREDLKGADYRKKLVWKTLEGLEIKPYHRSEDTSGIPYLDAKPGEFPFLRGSKNNNEWFIRQDILVKDPVQANEKAHYLLSKGVNSLGFMLGENPLSPAGYKQLFTNLVSAEVEMNFMAGEQTPEMLQAYYEYLSSNNFHGIVTGSANFDPLGRMLFSGNFYRDDEAYSFDKLKELLNFSKKMPGFNLLNIHGNLLNRAGAGIIEELAFMFAMLSEYLVKLSGNGQDIRKLMQTVKLHVGTGSNYFMEMAKIRAARLLWSLMLKAFHVEPEGLHPVIHAETARYNKTAYDPNVNMLRSTTEALSAVLAGVHSFTVHPFNETYETPGSFAERIARNQQIILKEEAYCNKVADPAAGSWYIESLTHSIATQAWELFRETENLGGFTEAFKKGFIQDKIAGTRDRRNEALACRKDILVGVNHYPDFHETKSDGISAPQNQANIQASSHPLGKPLTAYSATAPFEVLRMKTDAFAKQKGRPRAFLLPHGNLTMRVARSRFAGNFFACGGFEVIDHTGFQSIKAGMDAARQKQADIIVWCSSDDSYLEMAPEALALLPQGTHLVIAGYPEDMIDSLREAGIQHFIHLRSNLVDELAKFQDLLGI